jgi:hypothetical protein
MRRTLAAFAVATALGASPSSAAAPALSNPGAQIENFTPAIVSDVLTELGAQNIEQRNSDGDQIVKFTDAGIPYNFVLMCDAGVCTGLFMVVGMITDKNKYPLELLNASNKKNPFLTVTQQDEDRILFARILVTDGGVSKKNLAVNIVGFAFAVQESLKYLTTQLVASYQQGGPAQYQRASLGMSPPRPVFLSPQEIAHAMPTLAPHHGTSLRQPR